MSDKEDLKFELNKETTAELGPEELGEVSGGGFRPVVDGGEGSSASCCVGCNTDGSTVYICPKQGGCK